MKWIIPAITGGICAYLGFRIDSAVFWVQAIFVAVVVSIMD